MSAQFDGEEQKAGVIAPVFFLFQLKSFQHIVVKRL